MWVLECLIPGKHDEHILLTDEKYLIGRKDCHILVNENGVSRKHAVLTTSSGLKPNGCSSVRLTDSSKFGTFVNGEKVENSLELNAEDEVYFGQENCKFRLTSKGMMVTTSCIGDQNTKKQLTSCLQKLGGQLVSDWNEQCNYLVMEKITFTIKVVSALLSCRPIVTPDYFTRLLESRKIPNSRWLSHESFKPEIGEPLLKGHENFFEHDEKRKVVFRKKKFFTFSKKQHKRLNHVITVAGGHLELINEGNNKFYKVAAEENTIVLSPEPKDEASKLGNLRKFTQEIRNILLKNGRRMIKESEVGLAIFFKSLERYCNVEAKEGMSTESASFMNSSHFRLDATQSQMSVSNTNLLEGTDTALDTFRNTNREILAKESQITPGKKRRRSPTWDKSVIAESMPVDASVTDRDIPEVESQNEEVTEAVKKRRKQTFDGFFEPKSSSSSHAVKEEKNPFDVMEPRLAINPESLPSIVTDTIQKGKGKREMKVLVQSSVKQEEPENKEEGSRTLAQSEEPTTSVRIKDVKPVISTQKDTKDTHIKEMNANRRENYDQDKKGYNEGFLTTQCKNNIKIEPENGDTLHTVVTVEFVSLVRKKPGKEQENAVVVDCHVKNFKTFRKAIFPGKDRGIPRIIGGDDLTAYRREDINKDLVFAGLLAKESKQDEDERFLDRLFNFSEDPALKRKKLR